MRNQGLEVRTFRAFRRLLDSTDTLGGMVGRGADRSFYWKASTLLGDTNPKTRKSLAKLGILTKVLHLAPARKSGFNLCASMTPGCEAACLDTSGHGRFDKTQASRIAKARWLMLDRETFLAKLDREISNGARQAERLGLRFAVRLNATSDVRWETLRLDGETLMERHPDVQFYDYTKHSNRRGIPANYHLTFSLADGNEAAALEAFRRGLNVAVVLWGQDP